MVGLASHGACRRASIALDVSFAGAVCLSAMLRGWIAGALLLFTFASDAAAVDQPISARKLILRRTASGQEKLSFLSKDTTAPFPAIGSADDPASGTPGGVVIEIFSQNAGAATITVPPAVGWVTRDGAPPLYKFVNKLAPAGVSTVSSLLMKSGKAIRLRGAATGLPAGGALGPVGIRFTLGSTRACALFDATTIRRDEGRVFLARDATPTILTDCSNASLGGFGCTDGADAPTCGGTCPAGSACGTRDLSTCECIAAAQPCGDTAPVCNGECPAGFQCGATGGFPLTGCGCVPENTTACYGSASCGGSCPTGLSCFATGINLPSGSFSWCECFTGPPTDACGGCPAGFQCDVLPGTPPQALCVPTISCNGASGYPTCDGTCPLGTTCQSVLPQWCACVP
jgi:hypothetical protein